MRTVLVFLLATSLLGFGQQVTPDAAGFERQYKVAFDAAAAGNRDQLKHSLDSFALPAEWFQRTFGAASDQLLQQYKTEFDYFEYSESRRIQMQVENSAPVLQVNILAGRGLPYHQAKPAPTSLQPLPESEEIQTRILSQSGRPQAAWASTFVFVDGRFRFFGGGGLPFWDPVRVHRSDMCDPDGHQPGGHPIDPVMPPYPEDARKQGTQGMVRLFMNVAKDGSVSSVEVVRGDPVLAESAKLAAMHWRYQPYVNCGQPMEGQDFENIRFALDNDNGNPKVTIETPGTRVRISSGVAAQNSVHRVNPEYPPEARRAGTQGTVVMKVIIDKEGVPQEVTVISGPPALADEAVKTVKQWRYKPYILNGEPVEVETMVQINFTLNER